MLKEVHRQGVWLALGLFGGGSLAFLQVVGLFLGQGYAPDWGFGGDLFALLCGLPVVMATAFILVGLTARLHERPGEMYDEQGSGDRAPQHHERFAQMWAESGADLRSRKEHVSSRATELSR